VEVLGAQKMQEGHWLLELAPGIDAGKARAAARALRRDGRMGFAANVYRLAEGRSRVILLDRVAVQLKDGATRADLARLNAELGTRVAREPEPSQPNVWWLAYRKDGDPLELAARLNEHPLVAWADPDKVQELEMLATPTDPSYGDQYYLRSNAFRGSVRIDVNAEWAWDLTRGAWSAAAGPLTVAVVDAGVQVYHPDLSSGAHIGYDAITGTWDSWGCTDCASNPNGESAHGTAVAGILSAQHDNGIGIAGLAPDVRIMPIRIFRRVGGVDQRASDCAIGLAINNAWYNGAHVMNNSWRLPASSSCVTNAINRATAEGRGGKGTVMVFAAGNSSNRPGGHVAAVTYPGNLPNVLTVSALQRDGTMAPYSSGGSQVDVAAFGGSGAGDIVTTDLMGWPGYDGGDYTPGFNGTSAAAPQAAAVAAMVLSRNPTLTELQVRDRIKAGADPWGAANDVGSGKLNAYRALVGRVSPWVDGTTAPGTPNDYTWTAYPSGGAGTYSYSWERDDGWGFYQVSTAASYTSWVGYDQRFTLRVTVTDGPDAHTAAQLLFIYGPSDCSGSGGGIQEPGRTGIPIVCP
jgi:hypothetical protein